MGVISSYLFLFVSFYFATYSKAGKPVAKPVAKKALSNGINGTNGASGAKASTNGAVRSRKA